MVLQQKNLNDQINIAMKKVTGLLTAGMFANYGESVKRFVSNEQGFLFMNQIKGRPAYFKKISERSFGNGEINRLRNLFFNIILC